MVFSSTIFLFLFLPITLLGYYLLNPLYRNIFLLIASVLFYAWGEPKFVAVLLVSIIANYIFGLLVDRYRNKIQSKIVIGIMLVFNLTIFFIYKYLDFAITNINTIFGREVLGLKNIALPIGISFFTFQAMSYVIDVYRNNGRVQKNPLNVGLYITFFPQLIAGPIVRYETVAEEIVSRKESVEDFSNGTQRFICGLAKKVILANNLATIADYIYATENYGNLTVLAAWLGSIAYMLQIYFDFSGYSDMAIGLGKMFGFHFNENFNYPYTAGSITDFWRRWHISLSTWFRDYVYIPLGGSRCSKLKAYCNLACVWLLTGIWHGASWNFILWGVMYLILLIVEKSTQIHVKVERNRIIGVLYRLYTLVCINFAWVLFRTVNISGAISYIKAMLGLNKNSFTDFMSGYLWRDAIVLLILAVTLCIPIKKIIESKLKNMPLLLVGMRWLSSMILLILCISYIVRTSYDPFIYFNF